MKVMIVLSTFGDSNGADILAFNFYQTLQKMGDTPFVFATDKKPYRLPDYEHQHYFPFYDDHTVKTTLRGKLRRYVNGIFNRSVYQNLTRYLKAVQPDIVHAHSINRYLSPAVIKACNDQNVPIVVTLHDSYLSCPIGTLMRGDDGRYCAELLCATKSPLNCLTHRCRNNTVRQGIYHTIEFAARKIHRLYHKADAFIATTEALRQITIRSGYDGSKIYTIIHQIAESYFDYQPTYENKGYFMYVGRLVREKGIQYLLDAMAALPDVTLHIVGSGADEAEFRAQSERLQLKNVVFRGFMNGETLKEEFVNCIATILPCYWFENGATSVAESFAFGKPVIGSDIGGIPESIDHGINGLLFEPTNVEALTACIRQLADNPDGVVEMGKAARQKAEVAYRGQLYYDRHMAVFRDVIAARQKRVPAS